MMFDLFRKKFGLWKLQRKKEKTRKSYKNLEKRARKEKESKDELESLIHEEMHIIDHIDDDIARKQQQIICRQAERYLIPTPGYSTSDGTWEQSGVTGLWHWSPETILKLKESIRQEQKFQRERWQSWIVLLTGFLGTLIGLLSLFHSN